MGSTLDKHVHWIGGEPAESADGGYLPTLDPFTGEVWAEIARGQAADVDRAVHAAKAAFASWRRTSPAVRAEVLWKTGDLIFDHAEELAELESRDAGKVIREVVGQMRAMRGWYRYYSSQAYQLEGRTIVHDRASLNISTRRAPYGVIGVIPAFNSPTLLGSMAIAPGLAAGNTVVAKPPETNSLSLRKLGELFQLAGLPDGCFNVVQGYGHEAGDALVAHPDVRKVWFTGGPASGRLVAQRAAEGLKPVVLELGGKSANIVFGDVSVPDVVNGVIAGIFAAAGQTCVAGSRLVVHDSVADELVAALSERAATIRLGDPRDPDTEMGPLSQTKILDGVASRVNEALAAGAALRAGGPQQIPDSAGWFYPPTVLDGVTNDMAVARNELFGPVLSVIRFREESEAIAIANDSDFGLAAGIWTHDLGAAHRVAESLDTGTVWVNTYRALHAAVPFGGGRESGYGRENGMDGLAEFTQAKAIWIETSDEPVGDPFVLRT